MQLFVFMKMICKSNDAEELLGKNSIVLMNLDHDDRVMKPEEHS